MKLIFIYLNKIGYLLFSLLTLYLLDPFNQGFMFGYLIVGLVILKKDFVSQNLDLNFFILLLFSFIYAIFYAFDPVSGNQFIAIYALFPPVFYLLGKYLVRANTPANTLFLVLFYIGFAFSISALISVLLDFLDGGFGQLNRNIPMFWTGNIISATQMGAFFTLNMCIPAILIMNFDRKKFLLKAVAVLVFILTTICVLRIGSRTQLVIFIFTSLISFGYILPKQTFKKNVFLTIGLSGVVIYVLTNVTFDTSADWMSTFADRMDSKGGADIASGGGRSDRWVKSLENLYKKPLGWDVREFGYSHNMWLDVLRATGFIPFIILIIYTLRSFLQIKKTLRLSNNHLFFRSLVLTYTIAFSLLFMVEPIFEAIFSLFVIFCLFMGVINKYLANFKA